MTGDIRKLWEAMDRGDRLAIYALTGAQVDVRCGNCNQKFSVTELTYLRGEFWCASCCRCMCGAPAVTVDADDCISCGRCPGSQPSEGGVQ